MRSTLSARVLLIFLLGLSALVLVPAPVRAGDPVVDAEAFEKSLKRIYGYQKRKRFKEGAAELIKLLKTHERRPWALGHRAEIEDLTERLAFGAAFPPPKPQDVVRGKIEKYEESKGYIRIRYDSETAAGDLRRDKAGYHYFPARARGSYLLEINGESYPRSFDLAPAVEIAAGEHPKSMRAQNWYIGFGSPKRLEAEVERWLPARIVYRDGSKERTVSESATCPAVVGERYQMQVKVNETRIDAALNRTPIGTAKKSPGLYGELRFRAYGWDTLLFAGTIEPSWIQDRLDQVVQKQLAKFQRTYTRDDHLPAWLFETPASAAARERTPFPVALDEKYGKYALTFRTQLQRHDWEGARRTIGLLSTGGAPAAVVDYLSARVDLDERRPVSGLAAIERVLSANPEFLSAQLLQGAFLRQLGRHEESLAAFHRALANHRDDPKVYELAILSMLASRRIDAAGAVIETAARGGVVSERLDALSRAVTKALHGPTWKRVFEYKSRNYHVFSNTDKRTCVQASKLLEQALSAYKVGLHWVSRTSERHYKVYLFGGKSGFDRYWQDLAEFVGHAPEHVAGVYIPAIQQLLLWTLGDKDAMLKTLRHEGFHQYLDRLLNDVPTWLNEGLAVYHESGKFERGKLRFGQIHKQRRDLLREQGLRPLQELIWMPPQKFYFGTEAFRNYAQSWAFVHMLMTGTSKYRGLLKTLLKEMQEEAPAEVMRRHLTPAILRELDAALRSHVAQMH